MSNWRVLVPCCITGLSMLLGLASVAFTLNENFYWATWTILWCVLADKLDGTAARLLGGSSALGAQLDSMSDLISFGVAPAVLVYQLSLSGTGLLGSGWQGWLVALACGVFVVASAVRLARFNITVSAAGATCFSGVPTTSAGAMVGCLVAVHIKYQLAAEFLQWLPLLLILLAAGMVSTMPVPKVVRRHNRWLNIFQVANAIAVYACGLLRVFPEYLLGLLLFYLLVGSALCAWNRRTNGAGRGECRQDEVSHARRMG